MEKKGWWEHSLHSLPPNFFQMEAMAPMRGLAPTATMSPAIATMAQQKAYEESTGHHGDEAVSYTHLTLPTKA